MWIAWSLGAMGLLATMLLLIVPLGRAGVSPAVVLFYIFSIGCVSIFAYLKIQGTSLRISGDALLWVVGAAIASVLGNLCYFKAINIAPNPGYPGAIEGCKMLVVTVLSVWLFAGQIAWSQGIGVLCCAIGVALICL